MPDIKNEELLSLHYQIEKAEEKGEKLEELLNKQSQELNRNKHSKLMFKIFSSILFLITIALVAYVVFWINGRAEVVDVDKQREHSSFHSEMSILKNELSELKKDQLNLNNLKDLYLYRSLIKKDTVYSVQIQSFTKDRIKIFSKKYTNALFYSDTSYHKLSLGIFETLPEAQEFRKILLTSGIIDKNIFVISYKEGKRLRIEDPF